MAPINNISFPQQQKPGRTGETEGLENARAERHSRTQESVRGQDRASISAEARQVSDKQIADALLSDWLPGGQTDDALWNSARIYHPIRHRLGNETQSIPFGQEADAAIERFPYQHPPVLDIPPFQMPRPGEYE